MSLHIVHVFPTELGLFGDGGNVLALQKRAEWSGIAVDVTRVGLHDAIPANGDIYVVGSGSTAGVRRVAERAEDLRTVLGTARDTGSSIVAISAGLHLLANHIQLSDGSELTGAGLIDARAIPLQNRRVGEVFADFAGFVNTGHTLSGSEDGDVWERNGILGSYLHGPLLPMNPSLADALILRHSGCPVDIDEPRVSRATLAAEKSRDAIRARLGR